MTASASRGRRPARASAPTSRATGSNNWGRIPSWDCVQISISPHLPQHAGRDHRAALATEAQPGSDRHACADYLVEDNGATRVLVTSISEDDIARHRALRALALVGSDGNCVATSGTGEPGHAAPALLRHLPAHHRSLCRASSALSARARGSQK